MKLPLIEVYDRWARSRVHQQQSRFTVDAPVVEEADYVRFFSEGTLPPSVVPVKWSGVPNAGGPIAVDLTLNNVTGYISPEAYPQQAAAAAIPQTNAILDYTKILQYNACVVVRWSYLGYESSQVVDLNQRCTLVLPAADWVEVAAFGNDYGTGQSYSWPAGALVNIQIRPAEQREKSTARASIVLQELNADGAIYQWFGILATGAARKARVTCGWRGDVLITPSGTAHVVLNRNGYGWPCGGARFTSEFLVQPGGPDGYGVSTQGTVDLSIPCGSVGMQILVNGTATAIVGFSAELD